MNFNTHQYIDRETGLVQTETLCYDSVIAWMYCSVREKARWLFNKLISSEFSNIPLVRGSVDWPASALDAVTVNVYQNVHHGCSSS